MPDFEVVRSYDYATDLTPQVVSTHKSEEIASRAVKRERRRLGEGWTVWYREKRENPLLSPTTVLLGLGAVAAVGTIVVVARRSSASEPASAPKPLPSCASNTWRFPAFKDLPQDVVARSIELQHDLTKPIGYQTIEVWHNTVYQFNVRMHAPNAIVPRWHRGADVEVCNG